jgi:hypothetical protein
MLISTLFFTVKKNKKWNYFLKIASALRNFQQYLRKKVAKDLRGYVFFCLKKFF